MIQSNQTKQRKKTIENCFLCNHFLWCLFVLVFWTICKLILGSIAFYGINFFSHFPLNISLYCCAYAIMLYGCSWFRQSLSFGGRVVVFLFYFIHWVHNMHKHILIGFDPTSDQLFSRHQSDCTWFCGHRNYNSSSNFHWHRVNYFVCIINQKRLKFQYRTNI